MVTSPSNPQRVSLAPYFEPVVLDRVAPAFRQFAADPRLKQGRVGSVERLLAPAPAAERTRHFTCSRTQSASAPLSMFSSIPRAPPWVCRMAAQMTPSKS